MNQGHIQARHFREARAAGRQDEACTVQEPGGSWSSYHAVGCDSCKGTGYKGRVGIYQVMPKSEEMNRIIMINDIAIDIAEQAQEEEIRDLRQSGLLEVKQGLTSLEKIEAVTNE